MAGENSNDFGQNSTSSTDVAWLMTELTSAKTQEQCLMQILTRCSHFMNKLKVEEMQLKAILREELQGVGSGLQSPRSVNSVWSADDERDVNESASNQSSLIQSNQATQQNAFSSFATDATAANLATVLEVNFMDDHTANAGKLQIFENGHDAASTFPLLQQSAASSSGTFFDPTVLLEQDAEEEEF